MNETAPTSTPQTQASSTSQSGNSSGNSGNSSSTPSVSSGNSPVAPSSPPSATPEVFEVKVNGKVMKMSRDEVLAHAQMSHAAQAKFDEAAKTRKQVEQIISTAKKNPIQALMDPSLGLTKDQIRQAFETWYTQEYIEPETLSPIERENRELKRYREEQLAKQKEDQMRAEQNHLDQLTSQHREYFQNQIIEAMDKSGLPKTKFFAQRMAFYMRDNQNKGWDAPLDLIVSQVKKEEKQRCANIASDLEPSQLVQYFVEMYGEDVINKIRKHDLEQLRTKRQFPAVSQPNGSDGYGNSNSGEKVSFAEVNRRLKEMRAGKR